MPKMQCPKKGFDKVAGEVKRNRSFSGEQIREMDRKGRTRF